MIHHWSKPRKPTLEECQELVGGYIEFAFHGPDMQLIVNEEGILKGMPVNPSATQLLRDKLGTQDTQELYGPALVLTGKAMLD